jgi:acyl-CoA dehydrogenase
MVLGEGRGFEIIQGRLGPGRIHHWYTSPLLTNLSMRCIGYCERAMQMVLARAADPNRKPFGKQLKNHDLFLAQLADLRIEIESARLLVLNAADMIDRVGAKGALRHIAMAKVSPSRDMLR